MNKLFYVVLSIMALTACHNRDAKNHSYTADISLYKPNNCKCKLYVEAYYDWVGLTRDYLTDSVNFRIYIDSYNDQTEMLHYHCNGDTIYAVKKQNTGIVYYNLQGKLSTEYKVIDSNIFSLRQLKAKHNL